MKITNIKPQVKSQEKLSIFVDGRFLFSLSTLDVSKLGLKIGMEINPDALNDLKQKSLVTQAKLRVLKLLSYRARSEREITDYLNRHKYDQEVSTEVMIYLKRQGYIDDLAFAEQWLKNRSELRHNSLKQTKQELLKKGISRDIIDEVFSDSDVDELELITEIIIKKRRQLSYQDDLKMMQYLARRGYNYDKIKQALSASQQQ